MNLSGSAWGPGHGGNTPQAFVAAWRHVVTIFRDEHATNVEWVWSPNVYCSGSCPFTSFYPGDSWVDWAALDGYNYASLSNDPWQTFAQIFGPSYQILTHLSDKPVMIGETSSAEAGGSKAQWITGMTQALASEFPRVRAIVWFQRVKETDWRVDSSPQSLDAFRAVARSRLFQVSASRQAAVS
jgi:beta-mannanase